MNSVATSETENEGNKSSILVISHQSMTLVWYGAQINWAVIYFLAVPTVPAKPTANEVYTLLVDTLLPQWYDLFLHLGIDRAILDKSFSDHPFDPHVCLLDMIKLWLQREDPPATWKEMADVLRCKLLEGRYAVIVEEKYCSDPSHPPRKH